MHKLGYSWGNGNCRLCKKEFVKNNKFQISCSQACAAKYWALNNPEKIVRANERRRHIRKTDIWVKLGITHERYEEMLKNQKGVCAICGGVERKITPITNRLKRLSVDHCHTTHKIRGLLCDRCNRGLGYFKDNVSLMKKAIDYLNHNQDNAQDDRPNTL